MSLIRLLAFCLAISLLWDGPTAYSYKHEDDDCDAPKKHHKKHRKQPHRRCRHPKFNFGKLYDGYPQDPKVVVNYETMVTCSGPYALCAYAQCRLVTTGCGRPHTKDFQPPIAECGCYGFPNEASPRYATNIGAYVAILDEDTKRKTRSVCRNQDCNANVNLAPMCSQQNRQPKPAPIFNGMFDIISTFNPYTWPSPYPGQSICTEGQYANCYSAGCLNRPAFNGANTTCYCPVYDIKSGSDTVFYSSNNNSCFGSKGMKVGSIIYNGLGLFAPLVNMTNI